MQLDTFEQGPEKSGSNFWRDDDTWKTSALDKRKILQKKSTLYRTLRSQKFPNFLLYRSRVVESKKDVFYVVYKFLRQCSEVLELEKYKLSSESFRLFTVFRRKKPRKRIKFGENFSENVTLSWFRAIKRLGIMAADIKASS